MAKRVTPPVSKDPNAGQLDSLDDGDEKTAAEVEAPAPVARKVRGLKSGNNCPIAECSGVLRTFTVRIKKVAGRKVQAHRFICDTCKQRFGGE